MYMYVYKLNELVAVIDVGNADSTLLLCGAIHGVLLDPGFKVPSPLAKAAQETATALTTTLSQLLTSSVHLQGG